MHINQSVISVEEKYKKNVKKIGYSKQKEKEKKYLKKVLNKVVCSKLQHPHKKKQSQNSTRAENKEKPTQVK